MPCLLRSSVCLPLHSVLYSIGLGYFHIQLIEWLHSSLKSNVILSDWVPMLRLDLGELFCELPLYLFIQWIDCGTHAPSFENLLVIFSWRKTHIASHHFDSCSSKEQSEKGETESSVKEEVVYLQHALGLSLLLDWIRAKKKERKRQKNKQGDDTGAEKHDSMEEEKQWL